MTVFLMSEETPFTERMRQICDDAPVRCEGYQPSRFRQMIDGCNGDFVPIAKRMLRSGEIQRGLWTLAKHDALDISMEWVVLQEPWSHEFDSDDLAAAEWRLKEVRRRVDAREPPDSSDW